MKKSIAITIIAILAVAAIALGVLYVTNNDSKTKEIAARDADIAVKAGEIETLNADVAAKAGEIETLNAEVAAKAGEIETLSADVAAKAGEIEMLNADVASKESEIASLNTEVTYKSGQIDTLSADVKDKAEQIDSLKKDVTGKATQIDTLSAVINDKAEQIETLKKDVADKTEQINVLTKEVNESTEKINELMAIVSDKSNQIEDLQGQLDQLSSDLNQSTNTPEPNADYEVLERLRTFFDYWALNRQEDMLTLCSPTWASREENPKNALFILLRNRTPRTYEEVNISGTSNDLSRFITIVSVMGRNNGKDPVEYTLNIEMVREADGQWYVNPKTLLSYDDTDISDSSVTNTPAPTARPVVNGSTPLYYNPSGGEYYHLDQNCKRIAEKFLPLQGKFTYAELNDEQFRNLKPCAICGAPYRDVQSKQDDTSDSYKADATPTPKALQRGFTDSEAVRVIQRRLKELGYFKGSADGDFGPATEAAVKEFQRANGLPVHGMVDEATLKKLNKQDAKPYRNE